MVSASRPHPAKRQSGFTYVGLIVTIAIIGLVGAATLKVDALLRRAAAEQELLEIGAAFSAALRSYADATPRGQPPLPPPSLQDLLKDPRYPGVRRHLRKIFVDPMTGKAEWGILYANNPNGGLGAQTGAGSSSAGGKNNGTGGIGVLAVYSLSQAKPLKIANFDARFQNLENKEHISDWKFAATGQAVSQPGQLLAGQAAPGQGAPGQPAASLFAQPPGPGTAQAGQAAPANPPSLFRNAPAPAQVEAMPGDPPPAREPPGEAAGTNGGQEGQDDPPPAPAPSDSR